MTANFITWITLMLLTIGSFMARDMLLGKGALALILIAAALKCAALSWQFMGLRAAHWFWRSALLAMIILLLGTVALRSIHFA